LDYDTQTLSQGEKRPKRHLKETMPGSEGKEIGPSKHVLGGKKSGIHWVFNKKENCTIAIS